MKCDFCKTTETVGIFRKSNIDNTKYSLVYCCPDCLLKIFQIKASDKNGKHGFKNIESKLRYIINNEFNNILIELIGGPHYDKNHGILVPSKVSLKCAKCKMSYVGFSSESLRLGWVYQVSNIGEAYDLCPQCKVSELIFKEILQGVKELEPLPRLKFDVLRPKRVSVKCCRCTRVYNGFESEMRRLSWHKIIEDKLICHHCFLTRAFRCCSCNKTKTYHLSHMNREFAMASYKFKSINDYLYCNDCYESVIVHKIIPAAGWNVLYSQEVNRHSIYRKYVVHDDVDTEAFLYELSDYKESMSTQATRMSVRGFAKSKLNYIRIERDF